MTQVHVATESSTHGGLLIGRRPRTRLGEWVCAHLSDAGAWVRIRLLIDVVMLYTAASVALFADPKVSAVASNRVVAAVFPILVIAMMRARRSPDERLNVSMLDTFAYILGVVSLAAMLMISTVSLLGGADPLGLAPRLWLFAVVYLGIARAMLVSIRHQAVRANVLSVPTLVIGAGVVGSQLVSRLIGNPEYGLRPVGFVDSNPLTAPGLANGLSLPVLGGLDNLPSAIARTGARHVILAFSGEGDHILVPKLKELEALGVGVSVIPRLYEAINERATLDHVGGLPLLTLHSVDPRGWQFAVKHAIDRGLALLSLCLLSPLLLAIAIGVRRSSPGPVLFRQRRVGRDGNEFTMFKYRTMRGSPTTAGEADARWAAEILGPTHVDEPADSVSAEPAEDRTTRFGRFLRDSSLDELPQLVNVLRGDMSLVGPRPERVAYVRNFELNVAKYADRHRVKSGITGWAQVNGLRGETSIADRVEWDNYYIRNWSLRLDLRIMALTLGAVFKSGHQPG